MYICGMTIEQLVRQVTSTPKWYAVTENQLEQKWLVNIKWRLINGTAKHPTAVKFFAKLGYKLSIEYKLEKDETI